ncbi:LysM domain-containing protein, partial [Faecalicatena contorta]|uniref:LysM peptidoglycan-binding domain-containing protein n=1 Tax=Faecalicatena contorta TaxID=39482 RepID=UPI0031DAFDCB
CKPTAGNGGHKMNWYSWSTVYMNGISNPDLIYSGQELKINGTADPAVKMYTVKSGDTLSEIAARYNTTYQKLAQINGIGNPDLIHPGQVIKIE